MNTRDVLARQISEADFQSFVIECAVTFGWWVHHHHDSRRSSAGWPDLVLLRPPDALFVELKRETGRLRPDQARVLDLLERCGLEVAVWRPSDADLAVARLSRKPNA